MLPILRTKLRKQLEKLGIKIIFTSGRGPKNLICKNKSKLLPNGLAGVYQLSCTCNALKQQQGRSKRKWGSSGTLPGHFN